MRETKLSWVGRRTNAVTQRGFAMGFVFVLVALLLIIAILVVTGAFNAGTQAQAVGTKYAVMNSAEAAANMALNRLSDNPNSTATCVPGTLNGATNRSCIGFNNLPFGYAQTTTDYANGDSLLVPPHSAYVYGEATYQGNRKVYVEAIAQPAPPFQMPANTISAAHDVNDLTPQPIKESSPSKNDVAVRANNNINVPGSPSKVDGASSAVGTDQLPMGVSGGAAVGLPSAIQVTQAAQNAKLIAQAGTTYSGSTISGGGTTTYNGNIYVIGDVNLNAGTVTLATGSDVYINGNLCISGTGSIVNLDGGQGILVVNGVVSSTGTGGYLVPLGQNTLLLALASDPGAGNPCGISSADAISLEPLGLEPVGTVYAPNGSVNLLGAGTIQGALDAGTNVDVNGTAGSAIQYDAAQANTKMPTGTMSYTAYSQY